MKRTILGLSIMLTAMLASACGGSGSSTSTGSGGSTSTGGTGGSTTTGGTGGSTTSTGGTGGSTTTGGTGGSTTSGSGGGAQCGGIAGTPCAANEYCDYPDDSCGSFDSAGTCKPLPETCPADVNPVCACDGKVYNNACAAAAGGADVSAAGGCKAPDGQFACGPAFCVQGQQYCQVDTSDVGGTPNGYACKTLPADCSGNNAACACLANVTCGNMCKAEGGGLTVTCPGG